MRLAVLIAVIALAVIMIAAAVGPYFVPAKTYQSIVEEALSSRLHARVVMDGFKLRLIPYPGYTIDGFALVSEDPPFRGMNAVEAGKVIGSLSFGALFGGDLDTDVEARDVKINVRSADGRSNFGVMLGLEGGTMPYVPEDGGPEASPQPQIPAIPAIRETSPEPRGEPAGPQDEIPDAPIEAIPSMPAPSIEPPPATSPQGRLNDGLMGTFLLRRAFAADGGSDERRLTLRKLAVVRGRIEVSGEESREPLVLDNVSIAARNISLQGGFRADFKMSGQLAGAAAVGTRVEGELIADDARREISLRNGRVYLGAAQLSADVVYGYGTAPPSLDLHLASPNLGQQAVEPALSYLGWELPQFLTWQGTMGADLSFRGTSEAGQIGIQLDASQARLALGEGFRKEPGLPFKVQADVLVRPSGFTVGQGRLHLEGSEIGLAGEIAREGSMRTRLSARGQGLALSAMRSLLPWLPDLDAVEGGGVDISIEGDLLGPGDFSAEGRLSADALEVAGMKLSELSGSFANREGDMELAALSGKCSGADFSGNGRVMLGDSPGFEFDAVLGDIDAKEIAALKGAVEGRASLVAKVQSSGADRFSLQKNFTISGTLVSKKAVVDGLGGAAGAFSEDTWSELEQASGAKPADAAAKELASSGDEVEEMSASFSMKEGRVEIEELKLAEKLYAANLAGSIDETGSLSASGTLEVGKDVSAKLIADPEARKKLLDGSGELVIPVKASGSVTSPRLVIDAGELVAMIEERQKPKPMLDIVKEEAARGEAGTAAAEGTEEAGEVAGVKSMEAPAIEAEPTVPRTVEAAKPAEKAQAKAAEGKAAAPKPKPSRKAPAKRRAEPGLEDQPIEDILRVIIGG